MSMPDEIYVIPMPLSPAWDNAYYGEKTRIIDSTKYHSDAKYKALEARIKELEDMLLGDADNPQARIDELLKSIEGKLEDEAYSLGAIDGYDYDGGVEYGLRKAAIIVRNARIDK